MKAISTYLVFIFLFLHNDIQANAADVFLNLGEPVDKILGPDDATYCLLQDPNGVATFEGFGPCRVNIERVTKDHEGTWNAQVGRSGKIITEELPIMVKTQNPEKVEIEVTSVGHEIYVHCSVKSAYPMVSCKFRDPQKSIMLPGDGLVEDRFASSSSGSMLQADNRYHIDCGLKIDPPVLADLGLWRCAIETEHEVHYGFATVLCPYAMMDPTIAAAVVAEPIIKAIRSSVFVGHGESLSISCDIPSTLDYCYIRSPKGLVYSVAPGLSNSEFEYVGTGLNAGECGVKIFDSQIDHSGIWTCHVGLTNITAPEQKVEIAVTVADPIIVSHRQSGSNLVIVGQIRSGSRLDYCRFVRADGLGFNSRIPAEGYVFEGSLDQGYCNLQIVRPTNIDFEPWTVSARITGQLQEISGREDFEDSDVPPQLPPDDKQGTNTVQIVKCTLYTLLVVVLAGALVFVLVRQRRRNLTLDKHSERPSSWRNSFEKIFVKKNIDIVVHEHDRPPHEPKTPEVA